MAADDEDPTPKRPAGPKDLTPLSVEELKHYIAGLEAEIARARSAISAKESHRSGVEGLFRR
jgi:uncharacterized small protein (DUF1192 family)